MVLAGILALVLASSASAHTWYSGARQACADAPRPMVCFHNFTRSKLGLVRLRVHHDLDQSANIKAWRIRACGGILDHTPCGDSMLRPFYQSGYIPWYGGWVVGENLAKGYSTSWGAFHALMHSDRHRYNILDRRFRNIGTKKLFSLYVVHYGRHY